VLYSDAHLHVNPVRGYGAEKIAKKFRNQGGWFMAFASLPPHYYGLSGLNVESYRKVIELINKEAAKAREIGLQVARFAGIHPAEIDNYYRQGLRPDKILELVDQVLKVLEESLRNNLIDGIGEVGRQHYTTSPERVVLSEIIMVNALALARDYDALVQLHLEQGGAATARSISMLAELVGFKPCRVIMHHTKLETAIWANNYNLPFTAPIKYFDEKYASYTWKYCMIESDFLDDPTRPGTSAYPWEIPVVIEEHIKRGVLDEDRVYKFLVDNVVKCFGVTPP